MTYLGSIDVPSSSSLEMIWVIWVFFPESLDKTEKVVAEIAESLKFGILSLY